MNEKGITHKHCREIPREQCNGSTARQNQQKAACPLLLEGSNKRHRAANVGHILHVNSTHEFSRHLF